MIWRSLYFITNFLGFLGGVLILAASIAKYRKLQFKPFLIVAFGLCLIGSSFGLDLFGRFLSTDQENSAYIHLKFSNLMFLLGCIFTLACLILVRNPVPWFRLILYTLFYGIAVDIFLGNQFFVEYNHTLEFWDLVFINQDWQQIIIILISLPILDILFNIIMRHRMGFIATSARISVLIYWIGIMIPIIFIVFPISDEEINFIVKNFSIAFCFLLVVFSFLREPLIFTLTHTKYFEIIIACPDEGDVAVGQYIWSRQETKDLKSHALSAIDIILNEMVQDNPEDVMLIRQIDLGKKKVIIERSKHLVGYMIVDAVDPTVNFGLRQVLRKVEKLWQKTSRASNTALNRDEFKEILRESFTFAIAANKII